MKSSINAFEFLKVFNPRIARGKFFIVSQFRMTCSHKECASHRLGRRADGNEAIPGRVNAEWSEAWKCLPCPLRNTAAFQKIERLPRNHHRQRSKHGNIDMLANTCALRLVYGRHYTDNAEHWSTKIGHRNPNPDRRVLRFAGRVHHSALSLDDRIHGLCRARIIVAAEARNGAINKPRIHFMQPAIAHAEAIESPTAVIFDQYIALFHEVG